MRIIVALCVSFLALFASVSAAEDKAPQCLEQRILIQQLMQEAFYLRGQYYQCLPTQVPQIEEARKAAIAEEQRLKALLKPPTKRDMK